jgi:uncharacterized membrane protein YjjP (DUF1212 family)
MTSIQPGVPAVVSDRLAADVACLLRYGAAMLRAGTVSVRTRESIGRLSAAIGLDRITVDLTFDTITLTADAAGQNVTSTIRVTGYGINVARLGALDRLGRDARPGLTPAEVDAQLDKIERTLPLRPTFAVSLAVALACAGFAYLNNGGPGVMLAAGASGGFGQTLRMRLLGLRLNQFVVTALCAIVASTIYCVFVAGLPLLGVAAPSHAAGFISSTLFLLPGFPLIAALVDLVQGDFTIGVTRFAYGTMLVLAGGFSICMIAGLANLTATPPEPWQLGELAGLLLRATSTFIGACGFAILYNSPWSTVWTVGVLALVGNDLRLGLHDAGMPLAPATFIGALMVGLLASAAQRLMNNQTRIALTVPGTILMMPGTFLYTALVRFAQGDTVGALAAGVPAMFIIGAVAIGLVTARLLTDRTLLYDP